MGQNIGERFGEEIFCDRCVFPDTKKEIRFLIAQDVTALRDLYLGAEAVVTFPARIWLSRADAGSSDWSCGTSLFSGI